MAKWDKGLLGKLSGSIGNVVVSSWKGIPYIRSKPSGNPSNTPAQQKQRSKFGIVIKFVNQLKPVINRGFKYNTDSMTELNSATSYLMKHAVITDDKNLRLDFARVLVARGDLGPPLEPRAEKRRREIKLQWKYKEQQPAADPDDYLLAVAYDAKNERAFCEVATEVRRQDEQYSFTPDGAPAGQSLHVYIAFASADEKDASDSVYLGLV